MKRQLHHRGPLEKNETSHVLTSGVNGRRYAPAPKHPLQMKLEQVGWGLFQGSANSEQAEMRNMAVIYGSYMPMKMTI